MMKSEASQKPQITPKGLLLTLFFWIVFTFLSAGILTYSNAVPFIYSILSMTVSSTLMLIYMFIIWFILVRKIQFRSRFYQVLFFLVAGIIFTVAWYYSFLFLFDLFFGLEYMNESFHQNKGWVMFSTFTQYVLVFAVIMVIESLKNVRVKEKQASDLIEISRKQEISTLKAQLNPHFLFNTLNSINASIMKSPEQAQEMVTSLSEMLRYSLESFEREFVPLAKEINFIKIYLHLEKKRLGDRLEIDFDVEEDLKQVFIPPMICQPLVENAVKHGIAPLEEGGKVFIKIYRDKDSIHFSIKDTGIGMNDDNFKKGIGIKNTNEMLQKRYGKSAGIHIEKNEPRGTHAYFSIPAN